MTQIEVGLAITIAIQMASGVVWAVRKEGDLRVIEERMKNTEVITDHLTRAGEGIKDELSTLKGDIRNINTNIEYIKESLEKLSK